MPHTLLLADDSVTIQRVIELTFADEDIVVVAVSDGDQAIARLEASPPDIVLADIGMPGKSGYEVAQFIRQTPSLAHIPVVLLTGAFEPVDQERAAEAGCDGVLAKPFEPQLVIGRVKELLSRGRHAAPVRDGGLEPQPPAAEQWTPPLADDALKPPPAEAPPAGELNDYFDRLDAAFATLTTAPPPPPPVPAATTDWYGTGADAAPPATDHWDVPAPPQEPAHVGAPVSHASPAPAAAEQEFDMHAFAASIPTMTATAPPPETYAAPASASQAAPSLPPPPAALPTLADAFAVILAAERGEAADAAPAWPATAAAPAAAAVIDGDVIEEVTRRVLDRLSDQVVRDTVADIVSKVAERLVTEEIERIKASIA